MLHPYPGRDSPYCRELNGDIKGWPCLWGNLLPLTRPFRNPGVTDSKSIMSVYLKADWIHCPRNLMISQQKWCNWFCVAFLKYKTRQI